MTLTEYELERQRRMEENRRRMEEFGLQQMVQDMQQTAADQAASKKRKPRGERKVEEAALEPTRRSKRNEGRVVTYTFELERSGSSRPKRDGPLVKEGECEEVYGADHVLALGTYRQEWEMFRDGYNEGGERIYDPEKGASCHQCRQKTLGLRTACSRCKSGLGKLCGDCLFARYGENVEEALANKDWVCPCCRDLCNCSTHRKKRKWEATGQLHRSVKSRGYLSVAHYLVLNKAGGLQAKRAALATGFCPADLADRLRREIWELEEEAAAAAERQLGSEEEQAAPAGSMLAGTEAGMEAAQGSSGKRRRSSSSGGRGKKEAAAGAAKAQSKPAGKRGPAGAVKAAKRAAVGQAGKREALVESPASVLPADSPAAAAGVLEPSSAGTSNASAGVASSGEGTGAAVAAAAAAAKTTAQSRKRSTAARMEAAVQAPARRRSGRH